MKLNISLEGGVEYRCVKLWDTLTSDATSKGMGKGKKQGGNPPSASRRGRGGATFPEKRSAHPT